MTETPVKITITNLHPNPDALDSLPVDIAKFDVSDLISPMNALGDAAALSAAAARHFAAEFDRMLSTPKFYEQLYPDRLISSINETLIKWQAAGDPWGMIPWTEEEAILRNYTRILNYGRPRKLSWRRLNCPQRQAAARLFLAGYLGLSNLDLGHLHPEHFRP